MNESIELKLSFGLSIAILTVAVVAGVFSFLSALDEAHELQDDVLRQIAQLAGRQKLPSEVGLVRSRIKGVDEDSRVIVQPLGAKPSALDVDHGGPLPLPAALPDGLQTLVIGGETFRVMVKATAVGERFAVAQEAGFRNEIARDGAIRTVMPFLILVPVLLLVVANLVRKMFRPVAALSREIDHRDWQDLHAIDHHHLPAEIRPFATAINGLLVRVGQSMETQRRFVADAAHELRSPLTALSLQAERLAEADMSAAAHERLTALRRGIERGRNLLDQLLTLARVQSSGETASSPISIQKVFRRVLEDLMPLAEARHIDIGSEGEQDAQVWVDELDMIAVVRNLVDNAIRYTPDGGRVDISVRTVDGRAMLCVRDNGPGIPLAERKRIFDPFYRIIGSEQPGSGLGLSIVQAIATRTGANIRFDFADPQTQTGLCVTVVFAL